MASEREEMIEEKRRLKAEYRELFDQVAELLFRHDPQGINYQTNTDEYESEAQTILPRLRSCHSEDDVLRVVHEEFVRWFGVDDAGTQQQYVNIAKEIWQLAGDFFVRK